MMSCIWDHIFTHILTIANLEHNGTNLISFKIYFMYELDDYLYTKMVMAEAMFSGRIHFFDYNKEFTY